MHDNITFPRQEDLLSLTFSSKGSVSYNHEEKGTLLVSGQFPSSPHLRVGFQGRGLGVFYYKDLTEHQQSSGAV